MSAGSRGFESRRHRQGAWKSSGRLLGSYPRSCGFKSRRALQFVGPEFEELNAALVSRRLRVQVPPGPPGRRHGRGSAAGHCRLGGAGSSPARGSTLRRPGVCPGAGECGREHGNLPGGKIVVAEADPVTRVPVEHVEAGATPVGHTTTASTPVAQARRLVSKTGRLGSSPGTGAIEDWCPACGETRELAKVKGCIRCLSCGFKQDCNGW